MKQAAANFCTSSIPVDNVPTKMFSVSHNKYPWISHQIWCLNTTHQCFWSITDKVTDICKHCNQKGAIEFYYLKLADKIRQDVLWKNDSLLEIIGLMDQGQKCVRNYGFAELSWFWDPDKQWVLPTRCQFIISADVIAEYQQQMDEVTELGISPHNLEVTFECPQCHFCFKHRLNMRLSIYQI